MQYHVHVYSIARMVDLDVEAHDPSEAKRKALDYCAKLTAKSPEVRLPDCKKIALIWNEKIHQLVQLADDTGRME